MNRFTPFAFVSTVVLFGVCFLVGCSKAPSNDAAATTATSSSPSPSTEAATKAAADFVDALIKGDAARANGLFTPQAVQQTIRSGKNFAPPGWPNTTFRVGEVRTPTVGKACVYCELIVNTTGTPHKEEMCCLLRQVDNDWRVSGIAYWDAQNPGTMQDFETGQSITIPRNPSSPNTAGPGTTPPGTQTIPPRVAQDPAATSPY